MSKKIVVLGSCNLDFISYASRLPAAGETIHGHKFSTIFGGKGANQCVAASKLGGNTSLIGRVGDDVWGIKYLENLQHEKVNTEYVKITENSTTGVAQIIVADNGDNQIVITAGANQYVSVQDVEAAQNLISSADVLVMQLETPIESSIRAMELCKGISVLNGAPALAEYDRRLLTLPTIFCVNETETSIFTGLPVNNLSEAEVAAKDLIFRGCRSVLITLGSQGAIFLANDCAKSIFRAESPQVATVDTTGAGDVFIGALSYFLANRSSSPIQNAIQASCIVAADSTTRLGTQISFPGPEILEKVKNIL